MEFEWDREKAELNTRKHRVSFEEAVTVFYDSLATTFPDPDHSGRETRLITIGYSARDYLLVISHVERGNTVRIISARTATAKERKRYETENPRD
ncbi:MAG: BrnT family toxin [Betaproteobacteria bacterium]|nr:BrnT family toxin [Betaproteobacteria bacterium]MBA3776209.1 BrnT family toxin [Betaproteobacteria bacterium]